MTRRAPEAVAQELYDQAITLAGFGHPKTTAELYDIVFDAGARVQLLDDCPPRWGGLQDGDLLIINGRPTISDRRRLRILAHEFAHFLLAGKRRRGIRAYHWSDGDPAIWERDKEERVCKAFERLF